MEAASQRLRDPAPRACTAAYRQTATNSTDRSCFRIGCAEMSLVLLCDNVVERREADVRDRDSASSFRLRHHEMISIE
eukprot:2899589-Pleurochrysis_carterae.AAC.1